MSNCCKSRVISCHIHTSHKITLETTSDPWPTSEKHEHDVHVCFFWVVWGGMGQALELEKPNCESLGTEP